MKRYTSKKRFEIEVGNYTGGSPHNYQMKHLKIFTKSPFVLETNQHQIDLWLDPRDVEVFREALMDDMSREE